MKLIAVVLLIFGLTELQAQETLSASGGNASGSGGSMSYSAGQVVYTTNTGTTGSVAQGVQQPYEISVVSGFEDATIILMLTAYPNPATDFLILKVENSGNRKLFYQLTDINGKLLENKAVVSNETSIDMSRLTPAPYFLKVTDNIKEVKTFKIVKTNP